MTTLTAEQSARLLEAIHTRIYWPVLLALSTGMRRGEVLALRWKNVDLERSTLGVMESLEQSLRALRTDYLDIFFLHDPCEADGRMEDTVAYLERQKRGGRIRYLGLAGEASECLAFARWAGGVFEVLQVRDSLENREADCLVVAEKRLQITYGYLRAATRAAREVADIREVIGKALERTEEGMILVSSKKASRLRALAEIAAKKDTAQ